LGWFGPITAKTLPSFWHFVNLLFSEVWFHGEISELAARDRLRGGNSNNFSNTYLVRLNTTAKSEEKDEPFLVCYRVDSGGKTRTHQHGFRIKYDSNQRPTEYVQQVLTASKVTGLTASGYDKSKLFQAWSQEAETPSFDLETKKQFFGQVGHVVLGYLPDTDGLGKVNAAGPDDM